MSAKDRAAAGRRRANRRAITLEQAADRIPGAVQGIIVGFTLALIVISPGEDRAFIYFQF